MNSHSTTSDSTLSNSISANSKFIFFLRLIIAGLLGALGTLAFSPFEQYIPMNGYIAFISLSGLLVCLYKQNTKRATLIAFIWSIGLFGTGVNWVYVSVAGFGGMPFIANIAIVGLLIVYLSIYPALFGYLLTRFGPSNLFFRYALLAPALWQITEFLRGWVLTGFPWLQFGYTQIDTPLRGFAPIFGVEGVTFVTVFVAGCISSLLLSRKLLCIVPILAVFCIAILSNQIKWFEQLQDKSQTITLVQPNIDQQIRWNGSSLDDILQTTVELTAPYIGKSDIIIWPESAIPSIELNQTQFLTDLDIVLRENNSSLITGLVDKRSDDIYFNAALVLGERDRPYKPTKLLNDPKPWNNTSRYFKHHLVPFGETVPFESILRPIAPFFDLPMSFFSRGSYLAPNLQANNSNLLMAICYEIILGNQLRDNFTSETDFIVTITNDAWFGESIGPWQHMQMARMRALELARPVLRSANNGITLFIGADGKILKQLPQFTEETLTLDIYPTRGQTLYAQYGNTFVWLLSLLAILFSLFSHLVFRKNR